MGNEGVTMGKEKEAWQIKHDYKMPDGRVVHCTYEKAIKKLRRGKYGEGNFERLD